MPEPEPESALEPVVELRPEPEPAPVPEPAPAAETKAIVVRRGRPKGLTAKPGAHMKGTLESLARGVVGGKN